MPIPPTANLTIYQGDTWAQTFRFIEAGTPIDLTGATVESWARSNGDVYELAVTVGPAAGEVTIGLTDEIPTAIYEYDVEVTKAGNVRTWVRGKLQLMRDVTNET